MKITAWRITKKRYANNAFRGEGAKLFGGRWNPPGYAAVYAADSLSLAILELIVHLDDDGDLEDFIAIPVEFDDTKVILLQKSILPEHWSCLPISDQTQQMGKDWLDKKSSLILKVPSSVVHNDFNFVINPSHPDFHALRIGTSKPLKIDPRVSRKIQ